MSKSLFSISSLTTLGSSIVLSLMTMAPLHSQDTSNFNLRESQIIDQEGSSSRIPFPNLETIGQNPLVPVIDFNNLDLITVLPPDQGSQNEVAPANSPSTSEIGFLPPESSETPVKLAQTESTSSFVTRGCVTTLESDFDVIQLAGEVDLQELLKELESVYPSPNPLFFPTQPQEVNTRNIQGITLTQAIQLGQENNKNLQLARLNLERSQQVLEEALAERYPTVGVEASFNRTDSASRELSLGANARNRDTISTTLNTGLNLNYNLYDGGRTEAQISIAQEQIKTSQLDLERIQEETRLDITRDYYRLQSADARVGIEQQAVADASQSLRDAELLEQAGLGTKFDVLRAKVDLADANQRLTRAIADQRVARRQLTQRLSLGEQVEVFAADKILLTKQWSCSLEESIIKSYRNRAELEQFLTQRTIEQQQQRLENATLKPQIDFFANYEILGVLDDDLPPADGFQLGVNLRWTLFDGGRTRARVQQNVLDGNIADTRFADQRNKIRFEVEDAYYNLEANQQNIQTAANAVILAEESLRLARLRFGAGVGTQTDVINSQTELTRARGNLLRAITDYNLSLATLERAVSNLPDEKLFNP